ncbi:NADP-dependent oxidoreductase domain-containing protein [Mycena pura]|uniref:NADP-dependent oxidoreductase domain-containing protein n=1 Tax=Mycena pura TaxID=153505 RepID=A0AAD6UV45_9AGAR|nr:NADP-dependent oxidoreductase domain-containing protein [Mycena pura]
MSPTRKIGNATFSAIGFGASSLSAQSAQRRLRGGAVQVVRCARRRCTFWDTAADVYGDSEDLIGKWRVFERTGKRADIFLATKCGFTIPDRTVDGTPAHVRAAAASSLKRLGVDAIDLLYLHACIRFIRVTVGAMAEFVKCVRLPSPLPSLPYVLTRPARATGIREGKANHLGLRSLRHHTLRRAYAVHPIAAVEVECSPFTGLGPGSRARRTTIHARLLTGQYKSPADLPPNDFRRMVPRYSAANFPSIVKLAAGLQALGAAQVALVWHQELHGRSVPPPCAHIFYLAENVTAGSQALAPADVQAVRAVAAAADAAHSDRYPSAIMGLIFCETPPLHA